MKLHLRVIVRKPITWLYVAGAVVLVVSGVLWWAKVYNDPERTFWSMIGQSLATSGVSLRVQDERDGSKVSQTLQYSFGADNYTHALATVEQSSATIQTEIIATPKADYSRYLSIKTDSKDKNGKPLNFAKVLNVWAKTGDASPSSTRPSQLFGEAALGLGLPIGAAPVPIGNITPSQRGDLLTQIHDTHVYKVDFKKVKKQTVDGRRQYVYDVTLQTMAYASLMKSFAASVGLHDLDALDPNNFSAAKPIVLKLTVDVAARHLVRVTTSDDSYHQTYTAYDVPVGVEVPKGAISADELQKRLTELQGGR